MTPEQLDFQAQVLRRAGDESPLGVYAGMLHARADELLLTVVACRHATADGWDVDLVPASALEAGVPIYDPGLGPIRVLRVVKNGLGVECKNDSEWGDPVVWINPLSPTSPIVVLNGKT